MSKGSIILPCFCLKLQVTPSFNREKRKGGENSSRHHISTYLPIKRQWIRHPLVRGQRGVQTDSSISFSVCDTCGRLVPKQTFFFKYCTPPTWLSKVLYLPHTPLLCAIVEFSSLIFAMVGCYLGISHRY